MMKHMSLAEIASACGGTYVGDDGLKSVEVTGVVIDSRKVEPGFLFAAVKGERVDGHDYAAKAYQAGAEYVIANHPVEGVPEDHLVICESSYLAMIRMASNYRTLFSPLMIGVTGSVGKTTTIGKLAAQLTKAGLKVWIGAADTFRAAAIDQLKVWADRAGATMIRQEMGSDPASVAFDTLTSAKANGADVVLIDTAGRLHNKINLMNELTKIRNVMGKVIPNAPQEVMLVLDGSTGQNAFEQARQFTQATQVTSLTITKLDGTAKGGVVIGISDQFHIPVRYIGIGEGIDQLRIFDRREFVNALFGHETK